MTDDQDPKDQDPQDRGLRAESPIDEQLEELLVFIRDARGFDFTGYKRSSLARRIQKRMADVGVGSWTDYRDRLEIDADEFSFLFNTILINVTSFFRDAEAWTYLQDEIIPKILASVEGDEEIRIWSAGCSSGEEPYSLAIAFAEAMGLQECLDRVKIYATDLDGEELQRARAGIYGARALKNLPEELRDRYFEHNGTSYGFRADLRRRVIFGRHDITRDAPISRLDLLVCRNTLMYFNVEAQRDIIDRFNFALSEGGFLFLGKAEMLTSSDRFSAVNIRQRIFRRTSRHAGGRSPSVRQRTDSAHAEVSTGATSRKRQLRDILIDVAPYAVLGIDHDGILVSASSAARTQFGIGVHDIGRPFRDLEISYRPVEVRSVIELATNERRMIRLTGVERRNADSTESQFYDVVVQPLITGGGELLGASISFIDCSTLVLLQQEVKRVREDLETAYEELQSTNEELETTNEELQSGMEELETTNEELQSTNEELETTNEELQSGNEELETMNEELQIRSSELDETRTFLQSVLSSIGLAVVVLDDRLTVRSWNTAAENMWGLRADEVRDEAFFSLDFGLPLAEIRSIVEQARADDVRTGPVEVPAIDRKGRALGCQITCSPLVGEAGGVVIIMEPIDRS
ncbi:two-component system, chemotaxis family, CheB/CheR fusion protein [Nocardioides sp. YR527]|uniref:CheR family methyltransferase n=1 Tax=Nocardioides sp. YR527 TaxID=1881028 RepID=UPI00088EE480|nr:CheR family methyltransferase [Nocardioides sp. YR527]SDK49842.1 two-component system, chemotaxis family, CheB/CheR fusion protein [Nocardioides sp. YR527]